MIAELSGEAPITALVRHASGGWRIPLADGQRRPRVLSGAALKISHVVILVKVIDNSFVLVVY